MMDARSAREQSAKLSNHKVNNALQEVERKINEAVSRSQFQVEISGIMKNLDRNQKDIVVNHLAALGYKTEDKSYSDFRESWTSWIVSW